MIRPLKVEDLPRLCPILENEARVRMKYPDHLDETFFVSLWESVILNGSSLCFIDERDSQIEGFLLGMVGPDLFSGRPIALEQFWYVRGCGLGSSRVSLRLINAFLELALERRCVRILVGHWAGGPDLSRVYARFGFRPLETHFVKDVE